MQYIIIQVFSEEPIVKPRIRYLRIDSTSISAGTKANTPPVFIASHSTCLYPAPSPIPNHIPLVTVLVAGPVRIDEYRNSFHPSTKVNMIVAIRPGIIIGIAILLRIVKSVAPYTFRGSQLRLGISLKNPLNIQTI